eukprot:467885-Rhodomonas_salina.1
MPGMVLAHGATRLRACSTMRGADPLRCNPSDVSPCGAVLRARSLHPDPPLTVLADIAPLLPAQQPLALAAAHAPLPLQGATPPEKKRRKKRKKKKKKKEKKKGRKPQSLRTLSWRDVGVQWPTQLLCYARAAGWVLSRMCGAELTGTE